ncbi:methyl-accepting chemotaxis protein [Chitinibacter fontanus]|uniref:Methyl-accepting chemotaxis protein n=1 Tax=Chitinibacter fontanus TaxID=1737446 RepID=A0A7D5V943_9NEIS|nr:methyl-accepting chemotaxis protein [Chitinibacter fontanus]QLI81357.1 methyl-accepting chemotaxis protein [Chitinibacter fontanus]
MMKNWGVKTRLMAGFGLVLVLLVVVTLAALLGLGTINQKIDELVSERYPAAVAANELITVAYETDLLFRNATLADDYDEMDKELKKLDTLDKKAEVLIGKLKSMRLDAQSTQDLQDVMRQSLAINQQKTALLRQLQLDRTTGAAFINNTYAPVSNAYRDAVGKLVQHQGTVMDTGKQVVATSATAAFSVILIVAAVAVVVGLLLAWVIGNQVIRSLQSAGEVAEKIAAGDLTHDWRGQTLGQDELGMLLSSLKKMQDNLTQIIGQIRDNSHDVAHAARTLSQASQQIHAGTDAQSASASNMAAAVEEMSVSMDQVAQNSVDAEELARNAGQLAKTGSGDVIAAAHEMQAISGEVGSAAQQITELGRSIEEIGSIVVVIKDVADQTNLLALNAAIEAARAGDLGRGFAVVADEVRKLAERTTQSASQITAMVATIQGSAQDAVVKMSNGSRRVGEGLTLANQASDSIGRINASSSDVMQSVYGITGQVQEQRMAARDIAVNVEQIAQMAEENSLAVRNMVDSISRLESMSGQLSQTVLRFKVR